LFYTSTIFTAIPEYTGALVANPFFAENKYFIFYFYYKPKKYFIQAVFGTQKDCR